MGLRLIGITLGITVLTYPQALALVLEAARPLEPRVAALAAAAGAVTAEALAARVPVPGFANAAMDGFALRAADTARASDGAPVTLPVAGSLPAGTGAPAQPGPPGSVWEIMTGAPLPPGCDAVVPVEQVSIGGGRPGERPATPPRSITLSGISEPGRNVRQAGEDFTAGSPVLPAGHLLDGAALMALAASGHDQVLVRRAPRISLLTTGSELKAAGRPEGARIRDANGPYLAAQVAAAGGELAAVATVGDEASGLESALAAAATGADLILTTGGVSAGRLDLVPAALRALGAEILFHKVAIRPGKPVLLARLPGGTLVFGLPGNPVAVAVGFRFFVVPALRALGGLPPEATVTATCTTPLRARGDVRFFAKARASVTAAGRLEVAVLPGQESFRIAPLVASNAWAVLPEGQPALEPGEAVEIVSQHPGGCWRF